MFLFQLRYFVPDSEQVRRSHLSKVVRMSLSNEQRYMGQSNIFAEPSMQRTSYGSGQCGTVFGNTSFDVVDDKFCTLPSLFGPLINSTNNNNINNNSINENIIRPESEQAPCTSSCFEEELFLEDDDDAILKDLPSSCQDFENKELHMRLERNQSSPHFARLASPGHLSQPSSSGCPSAEPQIAPEDLEVQWINESFEEQQKQTLMYQSGDLKSLFYNESETHSANTSRSNTEKSVCSPSGIRSAVKPGSRLPYAKKFLASSETSSFHSDPPAVRAVSPSQLLKPNTSFEPLLTPKSEALVLKQAVKAYNTEKRRVSEPLARKPFLWSTITDSLSDLSACEGVGGDTFDLSDTSLTGEGLARHVSFASSTEVFDDSASLINSVNNSPTFDLETERLAIGIAEELLEGLTPATPKVSTEWKPPPPPSIPESKSKASRKLFLPDIPRSMSAPSPSELPPPPADVEASWEDLDDDDITQKMAEVKLEVASKISQKPKKPIDYYEKPPADESTWNDLVLRHVLEVFDVPEYKICADVIAALEQLGYGGAFVKWTERKNVLVAFDGEKEAREALALQRHPWLRFRSLNNSPANVQKTALENERHLKPTKQRPKTNVGVARRLVEGALGQKSNVSREQRLAESKQLRDAKAAKKSTVKWDD